MARIAGVELPKNKRMDIALTYIYGIGRPSALKILAAAKVDPAVKTDDLSADQQVHIRQVIDTDYEVEGDLRRDFQQSIKRLMDLGMLPRHSASSRTSGPRSAHAYQCAHPQRSAQGRRGQEDGAAQGLTSKSARHKGNCRRSVTRNWIH